MAKTEVKKSGSREGGGGGIPRPSGGITASPSKLAVRSSTSKVMTSQGGQQKHDQVVRTLSGETKTQPNSEGPYKLHAASVPYNRGQQKTLVNDKLYPRIPHPGPPMFHPSGPQRSQTLSLIPSHSSARTKTTSGAGVQSKVPNMPGNVQVRFGPPLINDGGGGSGGTRMSVPGSQYNPPPQQQANMPNGSGQQPIKGIMKASDRLASSASDIHPSQSGSVPYAISSNTISSQSQTPHYAQSSGITTKPVGSQQPPPSTVNYPSHPNPSQMTGPSQGQGNHGQSVHMVGHHSQILNGQGQMKIPHTGNIHGQQDQQIPPNYKNNPGGGIMYPGPQRVGQLKHLGHPSSYHPGGQYMHHNHPAHPTPPPYHQPPQPPTTTTTANDGVGQPARTDSEESTNHSSELGKRLASAKSELKRLASENGSLVSEYNKKLADQSNEIRSLKELNARLSEDNQELRDLCCFLDDDRQKGRKLAREWQRFGRYTASVMRQEVSNYQTKLKDLDGKQQDLVRDNLELKELCLYLDEERGGAGVCSDCGGPSPTPAPLIPGELPGVPGVPRDEGDGSSSSTNNDESEISGSNLVEELNAVNARENMYKQTGKMGLNDEVLLYIRNLEDRVVHLETGSPEFPPITIIPSNINNNTIKQTGQNKDLIIETTEINVNSNNHRPESVTSAMKVLEVHEQILEKSLDSSDDANDDLGDGEKALVREMCNVVWRKLEEG